MRAYLAFMREGWAALLFGFLAVFGGNVGQSFFVGLFGAGIQESLSLSASSYSGAYSLATLASAATVVWLGGLIDRVALGSYTAGVCVGLFAATLLLWQAQGLWSLLVAFYLLRLFGQALLPHIGSTTMARVFSQHRGKALSISSSAFPVGEIVLPLVAGYLILRFGWQTGYLMVGLWTLCLLLPVLLWLIRVSGIDGPAARAAVARGRIDLGARRALLGDYRYWLALPGLMAGPFIATAIFIHQSHILTEKGWSLAWFAACYSVYGAVHWLSSIATGVLVDRHGPTTFLPFAPLPLAGALLVLALLPGPWSAPLMMALLALSVGSVPVITGSLWPEIYGAANIGTIRSVNIAVIVFATALSPFLYGFLIDRGVGLDGMMLPSALGVMIGCLGLRLSYAAHPDPHPIAGPAA